MEGFIVTYYKTSEGSEYLLEKALDLISKENYYVVLASHTAVPDKIQKKCDFYFYQEENIVDNRKWSHGVAENNLLELSLLHLRWKKIQWTYKICYDAILNDITPLLDWKKDYKYGYVSCKWGKHIISTNSFFGSVDFILDNIDFYHSIEDMFKVSLYLEDCWEQSIINKKLLDRIYTYPDKESFFGQQNLMDSVAYSYHQIEFWQDEEGKFIINNIGDPIKGLLRIFDYYTNICLVIDNNYDHSKGVSLWYHPGIANYSEYCKNGYYLEITTENLVIRRNFKCIFGIKHNRNKEFKLSPEISFISYIENNL